MKTGTLSNRFYYHELDEKDASAIKNDLVLYNKMLHKAYKYLSLKRKGMYIKSNEIHKEDEYEIPYEIIQQNTFRVCVQRNH